MIDNAHGSHDVEDGEEREMGQPAGSAPSLIAPGSTENKSGGPSQNETRPPSNVGVQRDSVSKAIDKERLQEIEIELELDKLLQQRKAVHTEEQEEQQTEAWSDAAEAVKTHSDDMVHRWNNEIDVYLVFAALFSAILTTFNVQSYQLLQPSPDNTVISLQRISMQLQSFSISPPFVNATHSALSDAASIFLGTPSSTVPEYAVKLNTLWFSGLILSLGSTIIGILAKQWIGEYNNGLTGTSREAVRLRQYRLNNLLKWHVGHIIALIPIFLLISVALFLAGLLVLVWELHPTVARVASVFVAVVAGSTTVVTLLPFCASGCAYLTPQIRLLLFLWRNAIHPVLRVVLTPVTFVLWLLVMGLREIPPFSTGRRHRTVAKVETWLYGHLPWIRPSFQTWRGHEQSAVNRLHNSLDIDMLIYWYDTTLNVKAVSSAAAYLFDQGSDIVLDYFRRLDKAVTRHINQNGSPEIRPVDDLLFWQVLLCALDMGTMGLLQKRRFSHLGNLINYLPTSSSPPDDIKGLVGKIRTAAANREGRPGSKLYPIKEVLLYVKTHIESLLCTPQEGLIDPSRDISADNLEECMASLQKHMSRCLDAVRTSPEALHTSGHATRQDFSIARLNYMRSADQYLSCAAHILPTDPSTETLEQIATVLRGLHEVTFKDDLSTRGGRNNLRHGCKDYHTLIRRFLNTMNAHHDIFYPLLLGASWTINNPFYRLDTLRRCLEKHMKRAKHPEVFEPPLEYSTDVNETLEGAIKRYVDLCRQSRLR